MKEWGVKGIGKQFRGTILGAVKKPLFWGCTLFFDPSKIKHILPFHTSVAYQNKFHKKPTILINNNPTLFHRSGTRTHWSHPNPPNLNPFFHNAPKKVLENWAMKQHFRLYESYFVEIKTYRNLFSQKYKRVLATGFSQCIIT